MLCLGPDSVAIQGVLTIFRPRCETKTGPTNKDVENAPRMSPVRIQHGMQCITSPEPIVGLDVLVNLAGILCHVRAKAKVCTGSEAFVEAFAGNRQHLRWLCPM